MAEQVDIDAAFETLVNREQAAVGAIQQELGILRKTLMNLKGTTWFTAFGSAIAARQEFVVSAAEWVQYAVDENVMGALAEKIGGVFDALEAFLPTLGEGVREVYAVSARDPSFLAGLATEGKTFSELLSALLLPTAELFSFVDFMYAGNLYRPSDQLVLATFNQVQDVVSTVDSVQQLMSIQEATHWAGQPGQKLVLADAFRSLVREGELQMVTARGPVRKHLWVFTDMLLLGQREEPGYGIEKVVTLATANLKVLDASGPIRHAFALVTPADGEVRFSARDAGERDSWAKDIESCIESAATSTNVGSGSVATVSASLASLAAASEAAGAAQRIMARLVSKAGPGSASPIPGPPSSPGAPGGAPAGFGPPPPVTAGGLPPPPGALPPPPTGTLPPPPSAGAGATTFLPPPPSAVPSAMTSLPPPPGSMTVASITAAMAALNLPAPPMSALMPAAAGGSSLPPPPSSLGGAAGGLPPPPSFKANAGSGLPPPPGGAATPTTKLPPPPSLAPTAAVTSMGPPPSGAPAAGGAAAPRGIFASASGNYMPASAAAAAAASTPTAAAGVVPAVPAGIPAYADPNKAGADARERAMKLREQVAARSAAAGGALPPPPSGIPASAAAAAAIPGPPGAASAYGGGISSLPPPPSFIPGVKGAGAGGLPPPPGAVGGAGQLPPPPAFGTGFRR